MKIAVGSLNPVKIEAVKEAFSIVWPDIGCEVMGVEVVSGVPAQPMSDRESIRGAINRANKAISAANADYGVGLEGGLQKIGKRWFACGWIAVIDGQGVLGIASTARIKTPPKIITLVNEGIELGSAIDLVFKITNSKQNEGHFGVMTKGIIKRQDAYREGVVVALSRFIRPEIY
jgi:inosine/xanthosine triphosphatase